MIRRYILFCILIGFVSSCAVWRSDPNCTLDKSTNTISGDEPNQKEFYVPMRFIPRNIETLLNSGLKPPIEYRNFSRNTSEKHCGYHIYGCKDTTWAKQTMAYHIMDKYHVTRKDSTYLDTVLRLTVVDEAKLDRVEDDCPVVTSAFDYASDDPHKYYGCFGWAGEFFLPGEYSKKNRSFSVEYEPREGKYNYKTPLFVVEEQGLEAYSDILLERYGVTLTWDRVDTVTIAVYGYDGNK